MGNTALENKGLVDFSPIIFGSEDCAPGHSFGPNIRSYYLIHYVLSGKGTFKNVSNFYEVSEGQAFLIRPGEVCTYTADENLPWKYIWIGFEGRLARNFDDVNDVFEIDGSLFNEIKNAEKIKKGCEEYVTGILFRIYFELFSNNMNIDYISRTVNFIKANFMNNIMISDIAKSLNINRKYLARIFKNRMGLSMQEYLTSVRLENAKKLLGNGYSVSEAAQLSGYKDAFVFSKAFKNHYKNPPIYYRKKASQ